MDFGAGTARTGVAHLPKIVLFVTIENAVFGQESHPQLFGFFIGFGFVLFVAAEDSGIEAVFVKFHHLGEELPCVGDGVGFEVVAERPVAEHLEHGVVVSVLADLLQVIVFSGNAEAFLGVGGAGKLPRHIAQKDVLELVHPCVGEHQGRVVLDDHRCRRHNSMFF